MKRLSRIIFNALALLSLLLCFGAALLWVRGMFVGDFVWHNDGRGATGVFNISGSVMITRRSFTSFNPRTPGVGPPQWEIYHERPPRAAMATMDILYGSGRYAHVAGFAWGTIRSLGQPTSRDCVLPLWAATLLTAVAPGIAVRAWLRNRRQRRRVAATLCPVCNYDLRATPDRCPECGSVSKQIRPT